METTNPSGWGAPQPPKGLATGEGEVPLAPPPVPRTEVRTLQSDLRSMQEQRGGEPRPYVPKPAPPAGGTTVPAAPSFSKPDVPFTPPRVEPAGQPFRASEPPRPPAPMGGAVAPGAAPKPKRGLFVGVISFIVVIGLAAVGYYFIYPMFAEVPAPIVEEPGLGTPPETPPPAEPPAAPEATSTPEVTPPPEVILGIDAHASLFLTPADLKTDVTLNTVNVEFLRTALPSSAASVPLFKEIVVKTAEGKVIAFGELAKRLVPGFFTDTFLASFADDATYFTYAASDGTWFGVAAPLKAGANLGAVQGSMSGLQHDPDNRSLFLTDPGAMGVWRDGRIKEKPASLVDFAAPGATLGYAWFDRTLLITTNLPAGEEAARRLGF